MTLQQEQKTMDVEAIKGKVKEAINRVTGISIEQIHDSASYDTDLGLDSLAILEVAVSVESEFKFQATEEELASIKTIEDTVALVKKRLFAEVA
jgi:acyl carrier protein